jgi:hemolysin III
VALHVAIPRGARRLSVPLSLAMGWLIVIALEPLVRSVHPDGLALLIAGGLRLPYNHAVWHLFVMAGSACHFSCVLGYVIPPAA